MYAMKGIGSAWIAVCSIWNRARGDVRWLQMSIIWSWRTRGAQQFTCVALILLVCTLPLSVQGVDICSVPCVKEIYKRSCGCGQCVFSVSNIFEWRGICSTTCFSDLEGSDMFRCLETIDPSRQDWAIIQGSLVGEVAQFCLDGENRMRLLEQAQSQGIATDVPVKTSCINNDAQQMSGDILIDNPPENERNSITASAPADDISENDEGAVGPYEGARIDNRDDDSTKIATAQAGRKLSSHYIYKR